MSHVVRGVGGPVFKNNPMVLMTDKGTNLVW